MPIGSIELNQSFTKSGITESSLKNEKSANLFRTAADIRPATIAKNIPPAPKPPILEIRNHVDSPAAIMAA